jgi:hypothetical protein
LSTGKNSRVSVTLSSTQGLSTSFIVSGGGAATTVPIALPSQILHVVGADAGGNVRQAITAFNGSAFLSFRRSGGTASAPSATTAGVIGGIQGFGYTPTTGWGTGTALGAVNIASPATWTETSQPTYINFLTTAVNAVASVEAMRIAPSGNVLIGTAIDSGYMLDVNGQARFQTVGFGGNAPLAKPAITGAKGSNAALASLLAALVSYGLISDTTTA